MRYQTLPAKGWRDCNRIFFALSQCEDMDAQYQALNCLQVLLDRKANDVERRAPTMISLNIAYLSIQFNGLLDSNTISSQKLHVVDGHVARVVESITIIPDHGKELVRGKIIIYSDQDCPAYFKRQDIKHLKMYRERLRAGDEYLSSAELSPKDLTAIIVDVSPLDAELMAEHKKLLERFESTSVADGDDE